MGKINVSKFVAVGLAIFALIGQTSADSYSTSSKSWTADGKVCSEVCNSSDGCKTVCLDEGTAIGIIVAVLIGTLIFLIGGCVLLCFCCRWCCFSGYKRETRGVVHRA